MAWVAISLFALADGTCFQVNCFENLPLLQSRHAHQLHFYLMQALQCAQLCILAAMYENYTKGGHICIVCRAFWRKGYKGPQQALVV